MGASCSGVRRLVIGDRGNSCVRRGRRRELRSSSSGRIARLHLLLLLYLRELLLLLQCLPLPQRIPVHLCLCHRSRRRRSLHRRRQGGMWRMATRGECGRAMQLRSMPTTSLRMRPSSLCCSAESRRVRRASQGRFEHLRGRRRWRRQRRTAGRVHLHRGRHPPCACATRGGTAVHSQGGCLASAWGERPTVTPRVGTPKHSE